MNNSPLLISESPLQVLPTLACLIGLNQAIVIQQVHYWLIANARKKKPYIREGKVWTYNSYKDWQEENFPFWSISTIERIFTGLESSNLLISRQFEKSKGQSRKYYTIDYEALNALLKGDTEPQSDATPSPQSDVTPSPQSDVTPSPQSDAGVDSNLPSASPQIAGRMTAICGDLNKESENSPENSPENNGEREVAQPTNADALSGLLSVLLGTYEKIIRTPKDQSDMSWQVSQLYGDGVTVQELQEWLKSRRSLSAIRFIAQDCRLWRANLSRDRERRNADAYVGSGGGNRYHQPDASSGTAPDSQLPARTGQWGEVLNKLDGMIDPKAVATWFAPLQLVEVNDQVVRLRAVNPVFRDWIETNYRTELLRALSAAGVATEEAAIVFDISSDAVAA